MQPQTHPLPLSSTQPRLFAPKLLLFAVFLGALAVAFMMVLALGSVNIPLDQIVRVLAGGEADKPSWTQIILKFRLPKAITAALAGGALSLSGVMMQTFFRNPLADPFTLGISSGASLGVALVVLSTGTVGGVVFAGLGLMGDFSLAAAASLGAGIMLLMVLSVSQRTTNSTTILILGLMFGYLSSAAVSLLMYFSLPERIQAYINWGFGTFGSVTWGQLNIFIPATAAGILLALTLSKPLNALLLGEAYARSMGINVKRVRLWMILSTGILAGSVTAFCGPIGFIGLAIPHLCRGILQTSDHRQLLPAALLVGATVALLAALIAEMPGNNIVLPLNAITALFGAPVVMWVILRQRQQMVV